MFFPVFPTLGVQNLFFPGRYLPVNTTVKTGYRPKPSNPAHVRLETWYIDIKKSISIIDQKFYIGYIDNLRQHYQVLFQSSTTCTSTKYFGNNQQHCKLVVRRSC